MTFKLTFLKAQVVFKQTSQRYLAKMFQLNFAYFDKVLVGFW